MTETETSSIERVAIDALGLETAVVEPVGDILRAARVSANLSVREVADELHLLPNQVEALELGNYKRFRGEIFSKGYLRTYAKFLGLDDEAIIESYIKSKPETPTVKNTITSRQHIQNPTKGRNIQYWFLAAVIVLTFILWWVSSGDEKLPVKVTKSDSVIVDRHDTSLIAKLDVEANIAEESRRNTLLAKPSVGVSPVENKVNPPVNLTNSKNMEPTIQSASTETNARSDYNGSVEITTPGIADDGGSLDFRFSADCWVEVRNSNDEVIYADLKKAHETLVLEGNAPFKILLGYAPGVSLLYNGEAVDININVDNNSAQLIVGRS